MYSLIGNEVKAKEDAIDANDDLTAEEKTKAKAEAKAKADAAKEVIDKATTNAEVDQAKVTGTMSVDSVTPTAQAKPAAKQAIEDALKAKNDTIDANNLPIFLSFRKFLNSLYANKSIDNAVIDRITIKVIRK